jgi:predicted ATP-grasp superfamily ATP-dependent carboligase
MLYFISKSHLYEAWLHRLSKSNPNKKIQFIEDANDIELLLMDYKIIPLNAEQYVIYNNSEHTLFSNNIININILNNKSLFAKFMMDDNNFIDHIPLTIYYKTDNFEYKNNNNKNNIKCILKQNYGSSGNGIKIINNISEIPVDDKIVVSEYIDHYIYYVGNFVVKNGKILNKIYFFQYNYKKNFIKKGEIYNPYMIRNLNKYNVDDSIFENIFMKLNLCGIYSSDFIIKNKKIIIFEINPRPAGSLLKYIDLFYEFIDNIIYEFN